MGLFPTDEPRYAAVYAEEAAVIDASELIAEALERSGISKADLARRLGVSRSEITARLRGERNITVRKLAETLHALGGTLNLTASFDDSARTSKDAAVRAFVARTPAAVAQLVQPGAREAFSQVMSR